MGLMDTIKGVFSGEDKEADKLRDTNPNTPEQQKMYEMAWSDYQVFKQKRQEIEEQWREEERFYEGGRKHWEGLRSEETMKARPNSTDNIAFSQIESIVSGLTGWNPEAEFEGREPQDDEKAAELTAYMPYEMDQINFFRKYIKAVRRFVIHGLWVTKCVYDPNVKGGYGDKRFIGRNDFIPLDYGSFFPDPRIGDFLYIQQSKALIIHTIKDLEYFAERFGEQGKKVQEDNQSADVEIFDDNQEDTTTNKSKRSGLIEYWYKGKPKMMAKEDKELFKELAQKKIEEGKDPSVCLAKADGVMDGVHCLYISTSGVFLEHIPYVYDHGDYPVQVETLFTIEGTVWPKGYMRDMISPQIMLNKFSELAVENTAKMGNNAIIYEEQAIAESKVPMWQRKRSTPGAMLPISDINKYKELNGAEIPSTHFSMMEYYKDMLQKIPRRFDSVNGQANSQVTSGRQAEALQSASQGHLSVPSKLIQSALKEFFRQYVWLMAQFYTDERIGRVTGKPVGMSKDKLLGLAPSTYETVDPETQQPVMIDAEEEYVPDFDIRVKLGVEKPTDRDYWMNLAFSLFNMQLIDAKAVQYAVENGRLEPFAVIEQRMAKDAEMQQAMMDKDAQLQQMTAEREELMSMLDEARLGSMQSQVDALKALQDDEDKQFNRNMQHRKMNLDEQKILMGRR